MDGKSLFTSKRKQYIWQVNDESHTLICMKKKFLDAPSHLYKRVCPSVRSSVRPSVPSYFQTRTRRILCHVSGLVLCVVWNIIQNKAGYTAQDAPSTCLKITRDRRTYGRTYGRTDTPSYRDATAHLEKLRKNELDRAQTSDTFWRSACLHVSEWSYF